MCKAIEDMRAEERNEGLEQGFYGTISILRSMNVPEEQIIEKIMDTFKLTRDDAVRYVSASTAL